MLNGGHYNLYLILLLLISSGASAQERKLRVVDADGKPQGKVMASLVPAVGHAPTVTDGKTARMDQRDLQFIPRVSPIRVGTRMSVPHSDHATHHLHSFSSAKHFELRRNKDRPGDPGDVLIPGVVGLGCNLHNWMLGDIVARDTPYFAKIGHDPRMKVAGMPAGKYALDVHHLRQPGSEPDSNPVIMTPEMVEKSVSLAVELVEEPAPPSVIEFKFRRYRTTADAR